MMWGGSVEGAERESMRGGVQGAGGGDNAALGEAECFGFFSRVGPVRFARRGETDARFGGPVRWDV